ncbi:DUF7524 family protein [Halocatena marina]|uniref:Uncharacterized protein n=1 Tax=Halocatena marina TaxID=2934937 RepID=A0ABD5YRP6_9EURY|nr:hypothetical protein [Halocatena marina]
MQETLTVDVNPDGMHTLTVPERFGAEGAFDVVLKNHGEPTHVYLNLDDDLSDAATLEATNYYVEQGETLPIPITTSSNTEISGDLTVATAYGSEKRFVSVTIEPSEQGQHTKNISASVASNRTIRSPQSTIKATSSPSSRSIPPSPSRSTPASIDERIIHRTLPAFVFGIVAIILAFSSLLVSGASRILLGALALLAGIILVVYLAVV